MPPTVQPSVRETAFNCPYCFALTTQHWYDLYTKQISTEARLPFVADADYEMNLLATREFSEEQKKEVLDWVRKLQAGLVLIRATHEVERLSKADNLHLSQCYNCKKIAVWVYDRLLFPISKAGAQPNADLPEDISRDFEEAREIVSASPRGAAALLRLCVQKLCKHLGEKGKSVDEDIACLVAKGLNPLVQQSLDIVRVIGNEAVHPGVIDLKDDRDTALRLFDLVNAIAEQMISHPKVVHGMYAKLPEAKRKAIETRDKTL